MNYFQVSSRPSVCMLFSAIIKHIAFLRTQIQRVSLALLCADSDPFDPCNGENTSLLRILLLTAEV